MTWRPLKRFCIGLPVYGLNIPAVEYRPEGARFLRTSDITPDGELSTDGAAVFVNETVVDCEHMLSEGDLLFSRSGTLGRCLRYREEHGPATFAGYLVRFRPLPATEPRYLAYCAQATFFQDAVAADAISSTISNFNAERYANIRAPWWPLEKQRLVADYLDAETGRIDALIARKRRMIEVLRERWNAGRRRAVTLGLDAGAPRRTTGTAWLEAVPALWEASKLSHLGHVRSGMTPSTEREDYWDGDVPWVSPKDMKVFDLDSAEDQVTSRAMKETNLALVAPGSVLFVVRGMILAHSFPVAVNSVPVTINQDMKALTVTSGHDPRFLAHLFAGVSDSILSLLVEESAHGTRVLRMDRWKELPLFLPPLKEEREIVRHLDDESKRVACLVAGIERQLGLLREHRQALITAAVTGEPEIARVAA